MRQTGAPLALGQCLTAVASWVAARPLPHLQGTHAIAEGGSPLVHRIRRIAAGVPGAPELRLPAVLSVVLLMLVTAVGAPAADPGLASDAAPGSIELPVVTGQPSEASGAVRDTIETIRLLENLGMEDPSPRVRQEAAAELSDISHPAAGAALVRLAGNAADPEVRAEAAQQLDEFPNDEVVAGLIEVVFQDSVPEVRSNALAVLEDFRLASARAALRRLAREHPAVEVRRAAMAALSDGGPGAPSG